MDEPNFRKLAQGELLHFNVIWALCSCLIIYSHNAFNYLWLYLTFKKGYFWGDLFTLANSEITNTFLLPCEPHCFSASVSWDDFKGDNVTPTKTWLVCQPQLSVFNFRKTRAIKISQYDLSLSLTLPRTFISFQCSLPSIKSFAVREEHGVRWPLRSFSVVIFYLSTPLSCCIR